MSLVWNNNFNHYCYILSLCLNFGEHLNGMLGLFVGHPLDTLKVRQQTLLVPKGIIELTRTTYKVDGISGFFKGLAYPLLGAGVYNALFFGVYGNCLRRLQGTEGENVRKMCCENEPPGSAFHRDVFIAGCVGGVATVLYACPLDVIKIKLQAQTAAITKPGSQIGIAEPIYKGPYDAMKLIYKSHGIMNGLYRGLWAMMWRDVPTFGVYTLSYEHILCMFKAKEDRSSHTSVLSQVVAGGIAGILSWILVIPLDVIKSRIQADDFGQPVYSGIIDCCKKIYHHEGVKAFFLGTILMTIRAFPVNAATFVGYEYTMKACESLGSGNLTWLLIMPVDLVKTKLQADNFDKPMYKGFRDCILKTKKKGLRVMYTGLRLALICAFPAHAAKFVMEICGIM